MNRCPKCNKIHDGTCEAIIEKPPVGVIKKDRVWGTILFGWLFILSGISSALSNLYLLSIPIPEQVKALIKYDPKILWPAECAFSTGLGVISIFVGYNLFKQKELWRKIAVIYCVVVILFWLSVALLLSRQPGAVLIGGIPVLDIALLIYLTREKVIKLFEI
jgi:hypothetical protein